MGEPPGPVPAPPKKILLVEDNPDISESVEVTLRLHRFHVSLIAQGSLVKDHVLNDRPDLILMDVLIPKPNGYEVCRDLKSDERTKDIPIILLSAKTQRHEIETGFRSGADRYMTKPFRNEELLQTIASLLEEKKGA